MEVNLVTIYYHPISFLKDSLLNNYRLLKKDGVKFNHYLVDNNYPLEIEKRGELKKICEDYQIHYLNPGKNLGLVQGMNYFHHTINTKGVLMHLEPDTYLLSENIINNIIKIHKNNDVENVIYFNNNNLNDHEKNIFKINDVNCFELDVKNLNHTWIQSCFYNRTYQRKIQEVLDADKRENYDFVGEKQEELRKKNIPLLIMADFYEDMNKYRFSNYFEYEYFKALVYYWSKFEDEFKNLTFESFVENYDYYFEMDKFHYCYKNFKMRAKGLVIKPNFYFEKTKRKFNFFNSKHIINKIRDKDEIATKNEMEKLRLKHFTHKDLNIKHA